MASILSHARTPTERLLAGFVRSVEGDRAIHSEPWSTRRLAVAAAPRCAPFNPRISFAGLAHRTQFSPVPNGNHQIPSCAARQDSGSENARLSPRIDHKSGSTTRAARPGSVSGNIQVQT